ncbi:MAG TPA: NAD(P)/FAD-dependent oxidoreductase [Verrucomicrobiae bacterium]|nr:NAD(P)/FAD-dependent oxidoreductase [Verrucomicrobiae bacterium]
MDQSVIIVGGGIAGLAAACELARRRVPVTLLEASERFGGRILTQRHGSIPIELGAEFIHGRDPVLLDAIEQAGLSISEVAAANRVAVAGRLQPVNFWEKMEGIISRVDARRSDCSWAEFIARQNLEAMDRNLALAFAEGFNAADANRISAQGMLKAQRSADQMDGAWQGRVDQGYGALVSHLVRESQALGVRLTRNARVQQVRWKARRVDVVWREGRKVNTLEARAAIMAIPLGIWKTRPIWFEPPLPKKQMAVHELESGNVTKVVMIFRNRWWGESLDGFFHAPLERVPTWWSRSRRRAILTGWAGGPKADALLAVSPKQIVRACVKTLSAIFSEKISQLTKQLSAVHCHNWARDPNLREAYSYIPVNGLELPGVMAAPVADTLFFAGEFTTDDAQTGTVFGAYKTGLRAAREVCGVFSEKRGHKRGAPGG